MLFLPEPDLFIYYYIRKEALLSSQIEGTQSSFADLLLFESNEAPGVPLDDVKEVVNYIAAMNFGLLRLEEGFPLSNRLLREIHEILLTGGRGSDRSPGEFRRSQNWIGGTRPGNARYVPPPPEEVAACMGALEKFLHNDPVLTPTLIKAGLAHVQFETIHPFLDGNGRLGRLLITLLLCAEKVLAKPTLYLSLYLKNNREEYYELLQQVRTTGEWEQWLRFFLRGVYETSQQAFESAQAIVQLFAADRAHINGLGRVAGSVFRVHQVFQQSPINSATRISEATGLSLPTVLSALEHLQQLGIMREITGRARNRLFIYSSYLEILDKGTEPIFP